MIGKLLRSRKIYDGRVLRLKLDEVKLSGGELIQREIIQHPGAVAIIAFKNQHNIVMTKQLRHSVNRWLLEIPAGTLKKNESLRRCAERELVEETGFEAGRMMKLFSCYVAPGYSNELIHEFVATDLRFVGQHTDSDEFVKTLTMDIRKAPSKIAQGIIRDAKTICGLLYVLEKFPEVRRWIMARKKPSR